MSRFDGNPGSSTGYTGVCSRVKRLMRGVPGGLVVILLVLPGRGSAQDLITYPFVNQIHISGARDVSTGVLKRQMRLKEPAFFAIFSKPRFSNTLLQRDIAHLEGYYHSIGFFEAQVSLDRVEPSADGRFVDVYISVVEGRATRVQSVTFAPGALLEEKALTRGLLLKSGEPYNASLLSTDMHTLRTRYFNRGYLGVAIQDSVLVTGYDVFLNYDITPGTQISIRDIVISGNATVRTSVVEKEFTFKRGQICRLTDLVDTQRNLFETGLFTVVDLSPENLDPLERTVDVYVRLRERRPAYVEVGFGVGNIVGSRIAGEWGTRNLFGTGRTLRARIEYAYDIFRDQRVGFGNVDIQNIFYRYDIVFQQRRVFGTKLNLGLDAFLERDQSVENIRIKTQGGAIGASRRFGLNTEVFGRFSIEDIERQEANGPVEPSESHILATTASHDMRDFVLNPQTGWYRISRAQIGGGILGGLNDFYTLSASIQHYHRVRPGAVLAWRLRAGWGQGYGRSDVVPVEHRYFLGGGNSVRGYDENVLGPREDRDGRDQPVGGQFLLLGNVELRVPLPLLSQWNFSGAIFLDSGNTWAEASTMSTNDFRLSADPADVGVTDYRYSAGLGIRYNTPVGPIRLDYGWPLKRDTYTDDAGRLHITLGQIF